MSQYHSKTYGNQESLHLPHCYRVAKPALWVLGICMFAEAVLVTVDEPGVDTQDYL